MEPTKCSVSGTGSFRKVSRKGKFSIDGSGKTRCRRHERRKTCEALQRYLGPVMDWEE